MMRPCSMTMMQSEFLTVDSRWAMTKVVRPFMRASMPACTSFSVRVSMEDVASSRMSAGGSATAALVLGELAGHFPLLRPDIHLVPSPSLLTLVENDQLHACLAFKGEQKKSSLVFRELCAAPLACYCAPDHPLAGRDTLVKRDLAGSFIACSPRQIPDSIFAIQNGILASLPPGQRYFASSIESALTLVKAGLGYTLFPALPLARTDGLRCIPVTGLPAVPYGVYCQRRNDHPVLRQFLTLLAERFREK